MAIIQNPGESRGEKSVCLMRNMVCTLGAFFYNQFLKPNYKGRFFSPFITFIHLFYYTFTFDQVMFEV